MLLIVDDDPAFLLKARDLLAENYRSVLFAGNAEQARSLISSIGAAIHLVVVDLDLPGEDGFSLISELRRNFPDLPVVAVSGVFQPNVLASALVLGAAEALRKPVTAEWKPAIARALTGTAGARS